MAFVFKAKKTSSIVLKNDIPGPSEYNSSPENNVEINPIPFLSKASRFHQDVPTYNNQSPFFDTIIQNNGNISLSDHPLLSINDRGTHQKEEPMPSANFVSKVERFNYEDKKKTPGPGAYNQPSFLNKKPKIPNLEITKNTKFKKILPRNKSVPSIPSKVHIHGYNEEWDGQLVLNDIPVEEAQELPGGRCHAKEIDFYQNKKATTASWSKNSLKNGETYIKKTATFENGLGPGSYQVNEVSAPYSGRGSVGFISNTDRSSYPKIRKSVSTKRINNKQSLPIQESSSYAEMFENKDEDEEDEYVKDATPGPGYYYNASTASSFRTRTTATNSLRSKRSDMERSRSKSHRETKSHQGKGMNERFHERTSAASEIGPGEYQGLSNFVKKTKVYKPFPFQSGDSRFSKQNISEIPGPGFYNIKVQMGKDFDKSKANLYLSGFGGLTQRFKDPKLSDEEEVGPGVYDPKVPGDIMKDYYENNRPSAVFLSKPNRDIVNQNPNEKPPVGAYNPGIDDIGMKVLKEVEENTMFGVKKPGFYSSKPRFQNPKKNRNEEDDEEEVNWKSSKSFNRFSLNRKEAKSNSAFSSNTKRLQSFVIKNINPGPGSYHTPNQNTWNKATFNIQFIGK